MKLNKIIFLSSLMMPLAAGAATISVSGLNSQNEGAVAQALRDRYLDAQINVSSKNQTVDVNSPTAKVTAEDVRKALAKENITGVAVLGGVKTKPSSAGSLPEPEKPENVAPYNQDLSPKK